MTMDKRIIIVLLIIGILLFGCQYNKLSDDKAIELSDSTEQKVDQAKIDEVLEKEFEDNLDEALNELEEVEKI